MKYYINSAVSFAHLTMDIKELIPDANLRRRMSHVVKMGVSTAMECIKDSGVSNPDAIITAMGLGCLADSEKFLKNILDNNEQMLNPTPFIQSTFNTIGGQVALLTGSHCYNMTYSHRYSSFESALLDAILLLEDGSARNVLLGAADEMTPSQVKILERLGVYSSSNAPAEGSHFFMLGAERSESCKAFIETFCVNDEKIEGDFDARLESGKQYFTETAGNLWDATMMVAKGSDRVLVSNGSFKIVVKCI